MNPLYLLLFMNFFGLSNEPLSPIQKSGEITQKFATEFKNDHQFDDGLKCVTYLGMGIDSSKSCLFVGQQSLLLDQSQQLVRSCIKELFKRLQANTEDDECRNLFKHVTVRMSFWDENWDRRAAPHIAEIQASDGTIRYFQADPETQGLVLVCEEPIEPPETISH